VGIGAKIIQFPPRLPFEGMSAIMLLIMPQQVRCRRAQTNTDFMCPG
jgi:hypothetical protein